MRGRGLVVVLLVLLVALPHVAADHAFSHRVYVTGRVVDEVGDPVPGQPVGVTFHGINATSSCQTAGASDLTGPRGDIRLCRHAHELPLRVNVTISVAGGNVTVPLDRVMRLADVMLRIPGTTPARDIAEFREFERTVRVAGVVTDVLRAPADSDGVVVPAVPRMGVNVTVRLMDGGEEVGRMNATTDDTGWYVADLPLTEVPPGLRAHVTQGEQSWTQLVQPAHRRAFVSIVHALGDDFGDPSERPGTSRPAPLPWVLLVGGALVAAWATRRR